MRYLNLCVHLNKKEEEGAARHFLLAVPCGTGAGFCNAAALSNPRYFPPRWGWVGGATPSRDFAAVTCLDGTNTQMANILAAAIFLCPLPFSCPKASL